MSVTSTDNKVIYTGDNSRTEFPFSDFKVYATTDLLVQTLVIATGAVTTLVLNETYTVDLASSTLPSAGTVTLTTALPSTKKLIITRQLPLTQQISLVDNEQTPAKTFEEGFDRSLMIDQQQSEQLNRSVLQDPTKSTPITLPAPVAGQLLAWNSDASGLQNIDPDTLDPTGSVGGGVGGSNVPTPGPTDGDKVVRVNSAGSAIVLSGLSAYLDAVLGSTRGMLLRRGNSAWEAFAKGAANTVLAASANDPAWSTLTALLDALFSSAQGALLYRGGSGWAALAPGTSGQFLKTQGASADPVWATPSASTAPWTFVETLTLTGTSVSTATLPTDADLFMLLFQRAGGCDQGLGMRFNADSGANYDYTQLPEAGDTTLIGATGQTSIKLHTSGDGNDRFIDGQVIFQRAAGSSGSHHGVSAHLSGRGEVLAQGVWKNDVAITTATIVGLDSGTAALAGKVHVFKCTRQ